MAVSLLAYLTLAIGLLRSSIVVVYLSIAGSVVAGTVLVVAVLRGRFSAGAARASAVTVLSQEAPPTPPAPLGASRPWSPPPHVVAPMSRARQATEGCETLSVACTPVVVTATRLPGTWSDPELAGDLHVPGPALMGRLRRRQPAEVKEETLSPVPARTGGFEPPPHRANGDECSAAASPRPRSNKNASTKNAAARTHSAAPAPVERAGSKVRRPRGPSTPSSPRPGAANRVGTAANRRAPRSTGPTGTRPARKAASR